MGKKDSAFRLHIFSIFTIACFRCRYLLLQHYRPHLEALSAALRQRTRLALVQ